MIFDIGPGDVFAEMRLVQRLVVDAGIGGHDIHVAQKTYDLPLLARLAHVLPETIHVIEVDAARIGGHGHGNAHAAPRCT